jgi:hypothetical protein
VRRSNTIRPGATALKVSHSLPPKTVERLKELAYWERVSESSIIEFLLNEFFTLGDNATLGKIVKASTMTHRRDRAAEPSVEPRDRGALMERLAHARQAFVTAVDAWRAQPCRSKLNATEVARLELVATREKIERCGISVDAALPPAATA